MAPPNGGYGTLTNNEGPEPNGTDAERAALLSKPSGRHAVTLRLRKHFTVDINKKWGDIALLGCYVITGLLDSASVFIWGSFVSMPVSYTHLTLPTKRIV